MYWLKASAGRQGCSRRSTSACLRDCIWQVARKIRRDHTIGDWNWFGHSGGLLGYVPRTAVVPDRNLTLSVLTNASDALAWPWLDGMLHVARALAEKRKPHRGRPRLDRPLVERRRRYLSFAGWQPRSRRCPRLPQSRGGRPRNRGYRPDEGRVALAAGYAHHGEPVRLLRDETGTPIEFWAQGTRRATEDVVAKEMQDLYGPPVSP
jgi:hypothetical protein